MTLSLKVWTNEKPFVPKDFPSGHFLLITLFFYIKPEKLSTVYEKIVDNFYFSFFIRFYKVTTLRGRFLKMPML